MYLFIIAVDPDKIIQIFHEFRQVAHLSLSIFALYESQGGKSLCVSHFGRVTEEVDNCSSKSNGCSRILGTSGGGKPYNSAAITTLARMEGDSDIITTVLDKV
eukprot:TRINITY_DN14905_c0_g1_i1.p1 TRINITY_DN14905_c0_g1~~TRINITY_DN14905_c0_g1_i1.p1  ORF type:complete len:103 (-),score=3.11 TRINITY_DN14905_c0_g1_i1:168-476(-)